MRAEGVELALLHAADVQSDRPRSRQRRGTAGEEEVAGVVEEALGDVKAAVVKAETMVWSAWVFIPPSLPKVRTIWG